MEFIVRKEVSATSTVNILFRSNSIAMKLVSAYAKMIGTTYLQKVLSPLIKEVKKKKKKIPKQNKTKQNWSIIWFVDLGCEWKYESKWLWGWSFEVKGWKC